MHGDYRLGNTMFAPGAPARLVAIFDWELATIGDPLADVGYLVATWSQPGDPEDAIRGLSAVTRRPGFPTREQLIARYEERTGRSMSDVRWYMTLALWKTAVFLEGSYKRRLAGTTEDAFFDLLEHGVPAIAERAWGPPRAERFWDSRSGMADYFLQITGIEGESADSKHKGWLEVDSWAWGVTQSGSAHSGGGGARAGKATPAGLPVRDAREQGEPARCSRACASGQHLKEAKLVARHSPGRGAGVPDRGPSSDVLVSSYRTGGAEDAPAPSTQVSLNFAKAKVEYRAQKADGSLDKAVTAGHDFKTNTKV